MTTTTDLSRFTEAHKRSYKNALKEIKNGRKLTHWIWFIFPLIHGRKNSTNHKYYAIQSLAEAKAFLDDPYLGGNLFEISRAMLDLDTNNAVAVFGEIDAPKMVSSMTLFAYISEKDSVFHRVLEKYNEGKMDDLTLQILQDEETSE